MIRGDEVVQIGEDVNNATVGAAPEPPLLLRKTHIAKRISQNAYRKTHIAKRPTQSA